MITPTNREGIESIIEFLESINADFTATVSNYTTTIDYYGNKSKYMKEQHSRKTFSAYSKIKSDVSKLPVPKYTEDSVSYFHHDIDGSFHYKKAIQIDVRKAYATVLYKNKMITEATYDFITCLSKTERLVSVGMLASMKHIFQYENGIVENYTPVRSPLSGFFFFAVKEIQELMNHCRMASGAKYIMTWVDSIYIQCDETALAEILNVFYHNGFESSVHILENFTCHVGEDKIHISLIDNREVKNFNIPHKSNVTANHFFNFITRRNANRSKDTLHPFKKTSGNDRQP